MLLAFALGTFLVVDDDGSNWSTYSYADVRDEITSALDVYFPGDYDIFEVPEDTKEGPPLSTLLMYPLVVWFCGETYSSDFWPTLTDNDEANLAAYLDAGGKLLLMAQDYLRDKYPGAGSLSPGQFPYDYLGIEGAHQEAGGNPWGGYYAGEYYGVSGGPFEGLSGDFSAVGVYSTGVAVWPDSLVPRDGASVILQIDSAGTKLVDVGVMYPAEIASAIFLAFGLETVTSTAERAELLKAALNALGYPTTSLEEAGDGPRVWVEDGLLRVWAEDGASFEVYDPSGRLVAERAVEGKLALPLGSGLYLWRCGRAVGKVIIP